MMNTPSDDQVVDLNEFASLAGFPIELIQKELVLDDQIENRLTMGQLREAMLKYLDEASLK
tara:strand:- start:9229 stop:9411 length:183 start_codon:yes stop_codon:yes gene_type:complete